MKLSNWKSSFVKKMQIVGLLGLSLKCTAKQTDRRADDTNTLNFLSLRLSTLSFSFKNPHSTSPCFSLSYLGAWPSCSSDSPLKVALCTHRHCLSLPTTDTHPGLTSTPHQSQIFSSKAVRRNTNPPSAYLSKTIVEWRMLKLLSWAQ